MTDIVNSIRSRFDNLCVGIDPAIDEWFLMKSPISILAILAVYLLFVLKIGPSYMANRKPYDLKKIIIVYNFYQVLFSAWLCSSAFKVEKSFASIFSNSCNSNEGSDRNFSMGVWAAAWWYFFSKIVDLLDTVFFVLRKKQGQVTFLHVYHHTITALFSWGYLKYLPGEQGIVIGLLNSFVHVIMYFYYMLSAMGPKYQKYLWWKKYMTWVQLLQFCLMLGYLATIFAMDCKLPKSLTYFFAGNTIIFLYLFANFYRKAYKVGKTKKNSLTQSKNNIKELIAHNEKHFDTNNNTKNNNDVKISSKID